MFFWSQGVEQAITVLRGFTAAVVDLVQVQVFLPDDEFSCLSSLSSPQLHSSKPSLVVLSMVVFVSWIGLQWGVIEYSGGSM